MSKRIFLAIDVPEVLKNAAESCIESFFKERHARIPKKEGWHITLAFCGYLDETEINKLEETVDRAVSFFKPFYLKPDRVSFMLDRRPHKRPRMVWLCFKKSNEFSKLKNMIEKEMGLGVKESTPHLTLVRFKEQYYSNLKGCLPQEGVDFKNEPSGFLVDHVSIYESHLTRDGADYTLLKTFNF